MNRNADALIENEEGKKSAKKGGFFSYLVCVLAAIAIWLVIMNIDQKASSAGDGGTASEETSSVEQTI